MYGDSRSPSREWELDDLLKKDHSLTGGVLYGLAGHLIELQARATEVMRGSASWRSATTMSGMARGAIGEALDRISGAFSKYSVPQPEVEITLNLAPADLTKDGTWLDLPIAIILLQAAGLLPDLPQRIENEYVLVGEVGLHGDIRRVPGVLSIAFIAKPAQKLIVPRGNEREAALILAKPGHEGCRVLPVENLQQVIDFFRGKAQLEDALREKISFEPAFPRAPDFATIKGQQRAKRAATIAAAGGHNLLLVGPPGEGKSLIASAIAGVLPRLSNEEKVELTRIYSAAGQLDRDGVAVTRRPFRSVHHSASKQSIVGGGSGVAKPGEVTLAHLGVLFLDELAEFSRPTIESLRQPMEAGEVTISRVGDTMTFPARFALVAAMNPCPCGYFGTESCRCKEREVTKYQSKISGPIMDRIDLHVEVERLTADERFAESTDTPSANVRENVEQARAMQRSRYGGSPVSNAAIPGGRVTEFCKFTPTAFDLYKGKVGSATISTRSMDRLAKVARTIADLAGTELIADTHVEEAASFVLAGRLRVATTL